MKVARFADNFGIGSKKFVKSGAGLCEVLLEAVVHVNAFCEYN